MGARTLSIDIGGSGIKGMVLDDEGQPVNDRARFPTPDDAGPKAVLKVVKRLVALQPAFDRVSVGFPGVVSAGVVRTAPNLGGNWRDTDLADRIANLTERPCRVVNDADMQGYGAIEGIGMEMMLTLGTGMGAAVFTNGHLTPNLELGHHPFRKKKSYEDWIGNAARQKIGNARWSRRVRAVIRQVLPIWNPRVLYLGGGNAKRLKVKLPGRVRPVHNIAGILGGVRLWDDEPH